MTSPRPLPASLLALFTAGALVVACSDDIGSTAPLRHYGTGSGSSSTSGSPTGSASNSGTPSSSSAGNGAASGSGSSTASAGSGSSTSGGTSSGGSGAPPTSTPPGSEPPTSPVEADAATSTPAALAFAVAVDNAAPTVKLADQTELTVTLTPQSGAGPVTLSVEGLPSDVTASFDNATLDVAGSAALTAKLTLKSISSTAPVATPFKVLATAGAVVQNAAATLTVKPEITINIPVNADTMRNGFGTVTVTGPKDIKTNPVILNIVNLDSTPHEVHAENQNGFNHGKGTFGQGQADSPVRQITATGTYKWHLHDDAPPGGPADSVFIIQ